MPPFAPVGIIFVVFFSILSFTSAVVSNQLLFGKGFHASIADPYKVNLLIFSIFLVF